MNQIQQQSVRKALVTIVILVWSTGAVYTLLYIVSTVTHNDLFRWLGLIVTLVGLLPGVAILIRMRRMRRQAREPKQLANI